MHMYDHNKFMRTWLKKEMFNIAEKNIHVFIAQRWHVAKAILMNFDFSWDSLSIQRRSEINIGKFHRSAV